MDLAYTLSNDSANGTDGDHMFLYTHMNVAIPYVSLLFFACFIGTTGNLLIISTVLFSKKLRSIENTFIVNLALADLCVTGFVDPFSIVGVFKGERYFVENPVLCEIVASVCLTSCFCSLLSIGAISFNRYVHICHQQIYSKIYSPKTCLVMVVGLWVVSFCLEMPNFIGWGDHVFDHKTRSCVWDRTADFSYTLFFALVGVVLPLIVISVCYARIFLFVRQAKKRIAQSGDQSDLKQKKERQDSIKLARTLFIIFVVFTICWTPYAFMVVLDVNDTFAMELHAFSILLAHTNSSINCVLYGVFNNNFRKGYKDLLMCVSCKRLGKRNARLAPLRSVQCSDNTQIHSITATEDLPPTRSPSHLFQVKVVGRDPCA